MNTHQAALDQRIAWSTAAGIMSSKAFAACFPGRQISVAK
jgi:hypothetical protein